MKILFVTPHVPYPPIEGWRIKEYYLIKELAKRGHELYLLSLARDKYDFMKNNVSKLIKTIVQYKIYNIKSINIKLLNNPLGDLLLSFNIFNIVARDIKKIIEKENIKIIHYDTIFISPLIKYTGTLKVAHVLSINDSYSLVLRERILKGIGPSPASLGKWIYSIFAFPFSINYEKNVYKKFQKIHVVSRADKSYLKSLNPDLDIEVIPNGVDTDYYRPLPKFPDEEKSLGIIGNFSVEEHSRNAQWFIINIFTEIKKYYPNIKLYLIGKDPPPELIRATNKIGNVIITGYVKDIRPYIQRATIIVDPRRERFGILNHILQAMSMENAVVGTPYSFLAIEGAKSWKNCVIVKGKKDFVSKIIYLLENEKVRRDLGKEARHLMKTRYSWEKIALQYEKMYKEAIELLV